VKASRVFLAAEQIEPLAGDHPKNRGFTGIGHPSCQIDRIVAAELRGIDFRGWGNERGAVALGAEAPDGAGLGGLEIWPRRGWPGKSDGNRPTGIETLDREAGIAG